MLGIISPLPYAALATIEYVWISPKIEMYVVFPFPMDQTDKPDHSSWSCWVDGNLKIIDYSFWNDPYVLRLSVANVLAAPSRVLLKYTGYDDKLQTVWKKNWHPWGWLPCHAYTELTTKTITTGALQTPIVAGVKVLFLDCSGGAISVRSFGSGVNGQVLHVARLDSANVAATMKNNAAPPGQALFLHAMADETLTNEYGGWCFVCDGTSWFDASHSKHV